MYTRSQEKGSTEMSVIQRTIKKDVKTVKHDEAKTRQKQLTITEATPLISDNSPASTVSEMLTDLWKLRQENNDSFQDLKTSLNRLKSSMEKLKQQTENLSKRLTDAENRVSMTEDRSIQQERPLSYLRQRS